MTTNQIEALLSHVGDEKLANQLRAAVNAATSDREFGLVFDRHMPETIELPGRAVRARDKVRLRDVGAPAKRGSAPDVSATWRVARTRRLNGVRVADIHQRDESGEVTAPQSIPVSDLVVVADFRDPIYPGLRSTGRIERGGDKPFHMVINSENYHALEALTFACERKVDCIYIDPPYNTGGDLTYSDKRVSREDGDKHAKWLSFMERRLKLAKRLLKRTGVIIVAIDDNEHAHLKLLMDQVFGEQNFISNVTWEGVRKNDSRYVSNSADYMLIYARSGATLQSLDVRWKERKPGVDAVLDAARQAFDAADRNAKDATTRYRVWWRSLPSTHPAKKTNGLSEYSHISEEGRLFRPTPLISPNFRANLRYQVAGPNGRIYDPPTNGWSMAQSGMHEAIANGDILFGPNSLRKRTYLDGLLAQTVGPHFSLNRALASQELERVLGEKRFDFPKDVSVLARWIGLVTGDKSDSLILDFFGGSGSTLHAVMEMNSSDGGHRQCILVTNNELNEVTERELTKSGHRKGDQEWGAQGIYHRVTRPRIETVVTGIRCAGNDQDGTAYSNGLDENVEFFELTYEDAEAIRLDLAFEAVAPLLWLRAGGEGCRVDKRADRFAIGDHYAVLFDADGWVLFLAGIKDRDGLRVAYVVTNDDNLFHQVAAKLPNGVEPVRLYENYLTNFEINTSLD